MATILCYHCKSKHTTVAEVKSCAAKNSTTLTDWKAGQAAAIAKYPTLVETPVTAAFDAFAKKEWKAEAAAAKTIPAHRAAKKAVISSPVIATQTEQAVAAAASIASATAVLVQETKKVLKGQDLELGMYQVDNQIYKVKWNKTETFKYVERLVITQKHVWDNETDEWKLVPKGKFSYANSMIYKLTSENKMTEEMAKAFHDATKAKYGVDYGFCCVCGKLLTVKKSIAAGIGPVCATKL